MANVELSVNDPSRLEALLATHLLDTPNEESFDRITRIAARVMDAPVAAVSLVDTNRQFFKSCVGLPEPWATSRETPLSHSFCKHVVAAREMLIINDSSRDARVCNNLAIRDLKVVAYIGAPLTVSSGETIGALCVIDSKPREWTEQQAMMLRDLAELVTLEIEYRCAAALESAAKIRSKQQELHFLADSMPQIVWTAMSDGRIDYYNKGWYEYTGLTFEQTKDWGWTPVLHPEDIDNCMRLWTQALSAGQPHETEFRLKRARDGEYRWHLARGLPMRDASGQIVQWVGTTTDIHDQKQNEVRQEARVIERTLQLQKEKRFSEAVLENISDGIVVCDARRNITYVNAALKAMAGIDRLSDDPSAEWAASHLTMYAPQSAKPLSFEERPLGLALLQKPVTAQEYQIRSPGGSAQNIVVSSRAMKDSEGNIFGAVAVWHDVTDLRRSQKELLSAKEAAETANQTKGEFLANMSHEIRTPMTSIIGYADMLSDAHRSDQDRREFVQIIRRNGEHLLTIINDILDLSKIDSGKMQLEQTAMSPARIMAEVASSMRARAISKEIAFDMQSAGDIPDTICSDPTRIRQVLLNLVSNAIKFTNTGGVEVRMSCDPVTRTLRLDVRDTGIGLTQEQISGLFKPFAQADNSTTRRFGGTGLGLAVSKRLVEMLGGSLEVQSEPNRGSTFSFTVQYAERSTDGSDCAPMADRCELAVSEETVRALHARVLLAEDSADNRRLVQAYLEEVGLAVKFAVNGRVAVDMIFAEQANATPFDCVLMDMQMPELDGYAATAELRQRGVTQLPIIAFTAHAMASERERCIRAGCDDYATKPVEPVSLINMIVKHINRARGIAMSSNAQVVATPVITTATPAAVLQSELRNNKTIARILPDYIESLPEMVEELAGHFARNDLQAVRSLAHQLKGSGGSYGFPAITSFASAVEDSIKAQAELERTAQQVKELLALVRSVEGYDRSKEKIPQT